MAIFYVDQLNGLDDGTYNGLVPIATPPPGVGLPGPFKTIDHAISIATPTDELHLLSGTYVNPMVAASVAAPITDLKIKGIGHVVIESTVSGGGASFYDFTAGGPGFAPGVYTWQFENINFKNWKTVIDIKLGGAPAAHAFDAYFLNCTIFISPAFIGAPVPSAVAAVTHLGPDTLPPLPNVMQMQNCTVFNLDHVFINIDLGGTIPPASMLFDFAWERNNIYDIITPGSSFIELPNPGSPPPAPGSVAVRSNANNCDVPPGNLAPGSGGSGTGLLPIVGGTADYNVAMGGFAAGDGLPSYVNSTIEPLDLSLDRSSGFNSNLLGTFSSGGGLGGEYRDAVGSTWWGVASIDGSGSEQDFTNRSKADPIDANPLKFGDDWSTAVASGTPTSWANDHRWFDLPGVYGPPLTPGPDAIAASQLLSSPVTLTTDSDPRWVIDAANGGGNSARILSPIFDAGRRVFFKGIDFWGRENESLTSGSKEVLDANSLGSARQVELRADNTAFTQDAAEAQTLTGTTTWYAAERDDADAPIPISSASGPKRFWQFRVTLRTDAS